MQCFLPKSRCITISIVMLDDSEIFDSVPTNQIAQILLIKIAKSVQVNHYEYFGLKYIDRFQKPQWIEKDRNLYKQLKKNDAERMSNTNTDSVIFKLNFEVRYYPRDPTSIDNENFRYQIFLQIRKDMASNKLVVKSEKDFAFLCGLILQSDFGDYHTSRFAPNYVRQAVSSHLLPSLQSDEMIRQAHLKLKGMEPVDAEYQFLEKIRWQENYGAMIFPLKDKKLQNCYLGLNPQGYALRYGKDTTSNYDIFWPRVASIKRNGLRITIKEKCDTIKYHHFVTGDKALCLALYKLSLDHFAFFKSKRDEKPAVKEPIKRTIGQRSSNEFGYASDTSAEFNQFSDDTFSSYPDSINTTHSTQNIKTYKKPKMTQRNCISDVEEAALSRKHRRVIMTKSQTETEDESIKGIDSSMSRYQMFSETQTNAKSSSNTSVYRKPNLSYDRIPPDYIYENKRSQNESDIETKTRNKRLKKRSGQSQSQTLKERRYYGHKELESLFKNKDQVEIPTKDMNNISFTNIKTRDAGFQVVRVKSGDLPDNKARIRRKLPKTEIVPHSSERRRSSNYNLNQDDSNRNTDDPDAARHRVSPSKRVLPNLSSVVQQSSTNQTPPVPKHRVPQHQKPSHPTTPPSYNHYKSHNVHYKAAYQIPPPLVPKHFHSNYSYNPGIPPRTRKIPPETGI